MQVEFNASADPSTGKAKVDRVDYESAAKGTVGALDTTAKTFTVTTESTKTFAVTYTGTLDAADVQVPKREVKVEDGTKMEVHGIVSGYAAGDPATFTVGTQSVSVTAAVLGGQSLANGSKVELKGTLSGTVLVASKIEVQKSESEMKKETKEIEGLVTAVDLTARTLSVKRSTTETLVLKVTTKTIFRGSLSGTDPLAKLTANSDSIQGKYFVDTDGSAVAIQVSVKAADGKPEGDQPKEHQKPETPETKKPTTKT